MKSGKCQVPESWPRHVERRLPVSGVRAVILSAAKDLARRTKRSFAALRMTALLSTCLELALLCFQAEIPRHSFRVASILNRRYVAPYTIQEPCLSGSLV